MTIAFGLCNKWIFLFKKKKTKNKSASIVMYLSLEKPFNPILGETYQGFIDGCPVFVE